MFQIAIGDLRRHVHVAVKSSTVSVLDIHRAPSILFSIPGRLYEVIIHVVRRALAERPGEIQCPVRGALGHTVNLHRVEAESIMRGSVKRNRLSACDRGRALIDNHAISPVADDDLALASKIFGLHCISHVTPQAGDQRCKVRRRIGCRRRVGYNDFFKHIAISVTGIMGVARFSIQQISKFAAACYRCCISKTQFCLHFIDQNCLGRFPPCFSQASGVLNTIYQSR